MVIFPGITREPLKGAMIAQDVRGSNKTTCPDILNVIGKEGHGEGLSTLEEGSWACVVIFRGKIFSLCFLQHVRRPSRPCRHLQCAQKERR